MTEPHPFRDYILDVLNDQMVTPAELANRWRYTETHLANLRRVAKGPRFIKLPTGGVRYRLADIIAAEHNGMAGPITLDAIALAMLNCDLTDAQRAAVLMHVQKATGKR